MSNTIELTPENQGFPTEDDKKKFFGHLHKKVSTLEEDITACIRSWFCGDDCCGIDHGSQGCEALAKHIVTSILPRHLAPIVKLNTEDTMRRIKKVMTGL